MRISDFRFWVAHLEWQFLGDPPSTMHWLHIRVVLAYFASWVECLGLRSPGNRPPPDQAHKKTKPYRRCKCIRYPSPVDGTTMIEGNCGQKVWLTGMVLVGLGHEGNADYDHVALLRRRNGYQNEWRRSRDKPKRENAMSSFEETLVSSLDTDMGDLPSLEHAMTEIMVHNADVLDSDEYSLYCGISKQRTALSKTVRGEPGRFLWASSQWKGSTNVPILQWTDTWYYGRTALNRGDLQWWDFETRIIYTSRSKRNACLIEKKHPRCECEGYDCNCLILTFSLELTRVTNTPVVPAALASRGAPRSLVRTVGAGSRGNKEKKPGDAEEPVYWVFLTYIKTETIMNQLKRGLWKLHLRDGHRLSAGVEHDMIVYYRPNVAVVVVPDDDGDLQPSAPPPPAPPPSALPPPRVEPAAASADSDDESDEGWMERHIT